MRADRSSPIRTWKNKNSVNSIILRILILIETNSFISTFSNLQISKSTSLPANDLDRVNFAGAAAGKEAGNGGGA